MCAHLQPSLIRLGFGGNSIRKMLCTNFLLNPTVFFASTSSVPLFGLSRAPQSGAEAPRRLKSVPHEWQPSKKLPERLFHRLDAGVLVVNRAGRIMALQRNGSRSDAPAGKPLVPAQPAGCVH